MESLQWSPTVPFYDEDNPTGFMGASNGTTCGNPLAQAHLNWNKTETTLINGNAWGVWNILSGLKYKFNMGVDFYTTMTQIMMETMLLSIVHILLISMIFPVSSQIEYYTKILFRMKKFW